MTRRGPGELRTRSGCRKCRERRVKCPEQQPICGHCRRLGFRCSYDIRLTWLGVTGLRCSGLQRHTGLHHAVEPWMFLNVAPRDLHQNAVSVKSASDAESSCSISPKLRPASPVASSVVKTGKNGDRNPAVDHEHLFGPNYTTPLLQSLANIPMNSTEGYLWSYFDEYITPQCVLTPEYNPYRNVILRLAVSSQRGPLFHCILAVAANQLHSIGVRQYQQFMWLHRAEALRELRSRVNAASAPTGHKHYGDGDISTIAQIVASTLMLCFFEILQDCGQSWIIHTKFAQTYLSQSLSHVPKSAEYEQFLRFFMTYIHSHNILAATAGTKVDDTTAVNSFCASADESTVIALAGCSPALLTAISDINYVGALADETEVPIGRSHRKRRDDVERTLQLQGQTSVCSDELAESQVSIIAEVKRLAALLYLYGRIDGAGPQESHMIEITAKILLLISRISLRTNTILWPLFIVAVLGVRPECDEDRRLILARLAALQETRQLGNVKKARCVIEDVWRARDLRVSDATKGWAILEGKHRTISLA